MAAPAAVVADAYEGPLVVERCADLPAADLDALRNAVLAMSPEERAYKGVRGDYRKILAQLGG